MDQQQQRPGQAQVIKGRIVSVMEQGVSVCLEGEALVLRHNGKDIRNIRLAGLEQLILMGSIELTSGARKELLKRSIPVIFTSVNGRVYGEMVSTQHGNAKIKIDQYTAYMNHDIRLKIAKAIVNAKMQNQRKLLLRAQRTIKDPELADHLFDMRLLSEKAASCNSVSELMGYEGKTATHYWKGYSKLIKNEQFKFTGRNFRPPRDEINAALSFGYSFITNLQSQYVKIAGLDPYIGFLHEIEYNRMSLALDLIELFRPVAIDSFVRDLINKKQLAPSDFFRPKDRQQAEEILEGLSGAEDSLASDDKKAVSEGAVYMSESGIRIFLKYLFEHIRDKSVTKEGDIKSLMLSQCYRIIDALKDGNYHAFIW